MRFGPLAGAIGVSLLFGACEVHVSTGPTAPVAGTPPPPPPRPYSPAQPPPPPPQPGSNVARFPGRIVNPPALGNPGAIHLNVAALKAAAQQQSRPCGPHQSTPGHWIYIDCTQHTPLKLAKVYSPRKIHLLLAGLLKLDAPVQGKLPDSVDHRLDGTEGPVEDQGEVGSCTALSLSSAMDNAIRRQNKPDVVSALHLWAHYGYPDIQTAGDDNLNRSIAAWDAWPYDERVACEMDRIPPDPTTGAPDCGPYSPPVPAGGAHADPQLQATLKNLDATGRWRLTEFDEIPNDPDVVASVLATGADLWISMHVGSTWMTLTGDTVADWTQAQVEGSHATLLAGYRHNNGQRQFLVHNSWGTDWGDHGYAWISENMLRQFMRIGYKVVVADSGSSPPPPTDPNALTDDDCGEGELVDSVTGRCAPMCPDDSRPANAQCGGAAAAKAPTGAPPPKPLKLQIQHR